MRHLIAVALLAVVPGVLAVESLAEQPVLQGDVRLHDPSVIETDNGWVAFHTGQEGGAGGGAVQIKTSPDGLTWSNAGTLGTAIPALVREELGFQPLNLWAPSISRRGVIHYLYYSASSFGKNDSVIGLATNAAFDAAIPREGWVDQGLVLRSRRGDNWNAIDPWRIDTADGRAWLAYGSYWDGIKMRELDPASGLLPVQGSRTYDLASRGGAGVEAPSIIEHDGRFYLFVSFDQCCQGVDSTYRIMVGRADAVTGPYVDADGTPMLNGGGTEVQASQGRFIGPGGQEAIHSSRGDLLFYHYYDGKHRGIAKLQVAPIIWNEGGWPTLPPPPE
jgi:arabinan endo-1,5-alpha-L-arabinosidase